MNKFSNQITDKLFILFLLENEDTALDRMALSYLKLFNYSIVFITASFFPAQSEYMLL